MVTNHIEPGLVDIDELLRNWPLEPVPRHLIADEAHHHAVEFKKQSGAAPEQIDDLMQRSGGGLDLDKYFEKKLEAVEMAWENGPPKSVGCLEEGP